MTWITDEMQGATFGGEPELRAINQNHAPEMIQPHRYTLWRRFKEGTPLSRMVAFIGLNPSTATPEKLDPTVKRCENYAKAWGFGGFVMLNLFSYRATSPKEMKEYEQKSASYEAHMKNGKAIYDVSAQCAMTVCCWGNGGSLFGFSKNTLAGFERLGIEVHCIQKTKSGEPAHPLYLKADLKPVRWE